MINLHVLALSGPELCSCSNFFCMKCLFQKRLWCGTSVKTSKQVHSNHCEDQDSKVDILSEESEKAMTKLETSAYWSLHSRDMTLFNSFHTNFSLCGYFSFYNGMLLFCLRRIGLLHRVLVAIAEKQKVHDRLLWKRKDS